MLVKDLTWLISFVGQGTLQKCRLVSILELKHIINDTMLNRSTVELMKRPHSSLRWEKWVFSRARIVCHCRRSLCRWFIRWYERLIGITVGYLVSEAISYAAKQLYYAHDVTLWRTLIDFWKIAIYQSAESCRFSTSFLRINIALCLLHLTYLPSNP